MPRLPRIPDILTTANLSCGVASILLASQGQLTWACWLVFAGAAFDVLDGWAARALGGGSEFGKQLDSLADMVTFGVAPGMLLWCTIGSRHLLDGSWNLGDLMWMHHDGWGMATLPYSAFVIPIASAWRLAKFNIDTRQSTGFLGLPTPANALFWASVPLGIGSNFVPGVTGLAAPGWTSIRDLMGDSVQQYPVLLLMVSVLLGGLMLSELPLPSLKFKHMKWKGNEVIYCLLATGLCLLLLYGILAVPLILLLYLLSPLWGRLFPKTQ